MYMYLLATVFMPFLFTLLLDLVLYSIQERQYWRWWTFKLFINKILSVFQSFCDFLCLYMCMKFDILNKATLIKILKSIRFPYLSNQYFWVMHVNKEFTMQVMGVEETATVRFLTSMYMDWKFHNQLSSWCSE